MYSPTVNEINIISVETRACLKNEFTKTSLTTRNTPSSNCDIVLNVWSLSNHMFGQYHSETLHLSFTLL